MRKLAVFALAFTAAVFAAVYLLPEGLSLIFAAALAVCGGILFFVKAGAGLRLRLLAFGAAAGMLAFFAGESLLFSPAEEMSGLEGEIIAEASDYSRDTAAGSSVNARVLNGSRHISARIYFDCETGFSPGDRITLTGRAQTADMLYGEENDALLSSGCFLTVYADDYELSEKAGFSLRYAPKIAAHALQGKISEIYSGEIRAFMLSLLSGSRDELYSDAGLLDALNVSGVRHVVVISGMHFAYIAAMMTVLFGKKRRTSIITAAVILLFAAMTGFSASEVRACVMQLFIMAAPFFRREGDSLTSLSCAAMLLLLINPYAAANIGFQLSFGSTLGIVLFSERIYLSGAALIRERLGKKSPHLKRLLVVVLANIAVSLGASVFTVPLIALRLGYTSIAAPLTNLLISWSVAASFFLGFASAGLGFIFAPAGVIFGYIAAVPVKYTLFIVRLIGKMRFAAIYTQNALALYWLIYTFIVLALIFIFKKRRVRIISSVCFSAMALCAVLLITFCFSSDTDMTAAVLNVGQGQCIAVTSGGNSAVIDCGSSSGFDAGSIAANYLRSLGQTKIDVFILTHYHADHANGADELLDVMDIGTLLAPDKSFSDSYLADEITALAKENGTEVLYVTDRMTVQLGDAVIEIYPPLSSDSTNELGLVAVCTSGDFDVLVTGDIPASVEKRVIHRWTLPDVEVLVAGHHGSAYSTSQELLEAVRPETAVISVGHNTYGHPADETLFRLSDAGAEIYRTDVSGNVILRRSNG